MSKFARFCYLVIAIIVLAGLTACLGGTPARGRGWSAPAAGEKKVYLTTQEGKLQALSFSERSKRIIFPGEGEWSFPPGEKAKLGSLFPSPAVSNGIVYLASLEGRVYALDAATGAEKWKEPYKVVGDIQASPIVAQGKVFIAATNKIFAIDALDGRPAWTEPADANGRGVARPFVADGRIWAKPAADEKETSLFFGTLDKIFYALDTATGNLKWTFRAGGAILTSPVVYKGKIYFGAFDGSLYAIDPESRQNGRAFPAAGEWLFKATDWIWSGPVRDKDTLYFATTGGKVFAVNASSGQAAWPGSFDVSSKFRSNPVIYKDTLIIASGEGRIYSLNLADGRMKWSSSSSLGAAILADLAISEDEDIVYLFTQDDILHALYASTGAERWAHSVGKK